jgi:hypothetical protein
MDTRPREVAEIHVRGLAPSGPNSVPRRFPAAGPRSHTEPESPAGTDRTDARSAAGIANGLTVDSGRELPGTDPGEFGLAAVAANSSLERR